MPIAILLKGLPGSGKSTRSSQQADFQIISRDAIRRIYPTRKEKAVIHEENKQIKEAKGNIIVDDTNMNPKTLERIQMLCELNGFAVEIKDMYDEFGLQQTPHDYDIYRQECKRRNALREEPVPNCVIDRMFLLNYPIYNPTGQGVIIVDLDGTLANIDHRLHYMDQEEKDRKSFFSAMDCDSVYEPLKHIVNTLAQSHPIVLMSARPDNYSKKTETRLAENEIIYNYLLMRSSFDSRPDVEVKRDLYDHCLADSSVMMAFDDRKSIIELWRSKGIYVFACGQTERVF